MKNENLYQTRNTLVDYVNFKGNNTFSYAIFKNIELIDVILKSFDRLNEVPMEISKYEVERKEICEKYTKIKDGDFIIKDDEYVIENKKDFKKNIIILNKKYKDVIDKRKKDLTNIDLLMESECELRFIKVGPTDLPDLSPNEMKKLSFMIK